MEKKDIINRSYTLLKDCESDIRRAKSKYYCEHDSIMDYICDIEAIDGKEHYVYSQEKTDDLLNSLMDIANEVVYYRTGYGLTENSEMEAFYRAFFYLVIKDVALDMWSYVDENVTVPFTVLVEAAEDSRMQLTREEFLSRYYALRLNRNSVVCFPGFLDKINEYLYVFKRSGFFMGDDISYISKSKSYIESKIKKYEDEELKLFENADNNTVIYFKNCFNLDILDEEEFEANVQAYFDGLFKYGNELADIAELIVKLFLIRAKLVKSMEDGDVK